MKLFVAFGDCGDYYCDGVHFLGAFETRELAEAAAEEYKTGGGMWMGTRNDVRSTGIGEYQLNERNPDEFSGN